MAVNVSNSFIGTPPIDHGVYYRAPVGTARPETPTTKPAAEWEDHGAVGEDGFGVTPTRNNTDIKMMGGDTFRTAQTEYGVEIVLTLLEVDSEAVAKTTFGDANVKKTTTKVEGSGTMTEYLYKDTPLPICSHYLRAVDGDKSKDYFCERGQVVSVGERRVAHSDVTRTEITIKGYKPTSEEYEGANVVERTYDPNKVPAPGENTEG